MKTLPLRPLHDTVLLTLVEKPKVSDGGVHLPDTAALPPQEGIVQAVGPGRRYTLEDGTERFVPTRLQPGNRVVFPHWCGQVVALDGEDWFLVTEQDIVGVID